MNVQIEPPEAAAAQRDANPATAPFDPGELVDDGVITSPWGPRDGGFHHGVDIDTPAGGDDVEVHCPVDGTVEFVGGQYGTVGVRDQHGYLHQFLHLERASVNQGDRVNRGDAVGVMGGRGPQGPNQYEDHVHYQVRDPEGDRINPEEEYPFYGDQPVQEEPAGPGDPPAGGDGPGSYGAGDDPAGPYPGDASDDASYLGAPLLGAPARRIEALEREARELGSAGQTWAAARRAELAMAAIRLSERMDITALSAGEAAQMGLALLETSLAPGKKGAVPDIRVPLRLAAYTSRAGAYELSARTLSGRATRLAATLGGGRRDG